MPITIESSDHFSNLSDGNKFFGSPIMENSRFKINGKNNVCYCEPGVILRNCNIEFNGSNGLLVIGSSKDACCLNAAINNNCSLIIGRKVYFNGVCAIIVSEECTISIGDSCLVSSGVRMRTADPHLIYDLSTEQRINPSLNIIIGDHVWIGQGVYILKGTTIGSGSIIGAMSVVAGKTIESNSVWGGNPAKLIRKGVFWESTCVHAFTEKETKSHESLRRDEFSYAENSKSFNAQLFVASERLSALDRLEHYLNIGYGKGEHDRLSVGNIDNSNGKPLWLNRLLPIRFRK